jgi:hypothetical protein
MQIMLVKDRYFLVDGERDIENVALKVLNELRIMRDADEKTLAFIQSITDAQDGDLAVLMLRRLYEVSFIRPEVV